MIVLQAVKQVVVAKANANKQAAASAAAAAAADSSYGSTTSSSSESAIASSGGTNRRHVFAEARVEYDKNFNHGAGAVNFVVSALPQNPISLTHSHYLLTPKPKTVRVDGSSPLPVHLQSVTLNNAFNTNSSVCDCILSHYTSHCH
jgi:hypothetical protein